jgi:galactokinase
MPVAIDFHTWIVAAPREDSVLSVHSEVFGETKTFVLKEPSPKPEGHWSDYIRGVVLELQQAGVSIAGANLFIRGNVPVGAGLSSSASVDVATAFALVSLSKADISRRQIALLCQRAENEFVGAHVGIMDPFVSAHGRRGHALKLDCRSLEYELLPLPESVSLVICDTGVKHQLAGGEYNARRRECEEGVALLQQRYPKIKALRDVTPEMLREDEGILPPVVLRRCRHVVSENARVEAAAIALENSDMALLGKLMYESHESLRDDYEVSCAELDTMVNIASELPGVVGARMTGGGFGGCTVNLVENSSVDRFRHEVAEKYKQKTGIAAKIYVTTASEGASEITAV